MCTIVYVIAELQKQNVNAIAPFTTEDMGICCMLLAVCMQHVYPGEALIEQSTFLFFLSSSSPHKSSDLILCLYFLL